MKLYRNALSLSRLRRQPSALVASTACFPLWLKICHRHIFLTRRAHPERAFGDACASLGVWALPEAMRCLQRCNTKAKLAIKQNDKQEFDEQLMSKGMTENKPPSLKICVATSKEKQPLGNLSIFQRRFCAYLTTEEWL